MCSVCHCVSVCHVCASACGGKKRVCDALKIELQDVVSHMKWTLGTEARPSARAVSTPEC